MNIKSPEAFRTISEVSKDLSLPQHVLRFWETKFVQIKPIKRGGGRRYYRPEDIELLKGIISKPMQNNDFTLDQDKNKKTVLSEDKSHSMIAESKRKKLMSVLNDLVELKKKLNQGN